MRKELIIQNATVFNDKNIKTNECIDILVDLIYLLNQGRKFTSQEKETLFFNTSKLLHSANISLRRLIFLFVKHLNFWQNSFILTGSLINEINQQGGDLIKPCCFRLLGQIIDNSSVNAVERYLKVAISNKSTEIASSALICTLIMVFKGFNVAKNWISEISEKLNNSIGQNNLITFHTLLLLKEIKDKDKLFLIKIFSKIADASKSRSQFALCQLIRYISQLMNKEELKSETVKVFTIFLERCTYKVEDSIKIEACRAIFSLKKKTNLNKTAIEAITDLLTSVNKCTKFAALKTLDKFISKGNFPAGSSLELFLEIERIIEDSGNNSSTKAYALSIFLKISKDLSDSRLEKMFKAFIEQYPKFKEDFKKEIVVISKEISKNNPKKNKLYYNFFSSIFKLDANPATKLEILDALIWYFYNDKDLKLQTLFFLAEIIPDCQYDVVKIKILNLLGNECQSITNPGKLVRYIYNQIILESPMVRASAISALGEIAFKEISLRKTIINLIKKSFNDIDSEVRERAFFYYKAVTQLKDNNEEENEENNTEKTNENNNIVDFIFPSKKKGNNPLNNDLDIDIIQTILKNEKDNLLGSDDIANELKGILNNPEKISQILIKNKMNEPKKTDKKNIKEEEENKTEEDDYKKTMFRKLYGNPKIITPYKKLTDQTAEYFTKYSKIIHEQIVVLDFEITNTIELQSINNVSIDIEDSQNSGFDFNKTEIIEIKSLNTNQTGHLYLKLSKEPNIVYSSCSFHIILKFDLQELDVKGNPHGIPVKETYKIDKLIEISYADYYIPNSKVNLENFSEFWQMAEKSKYKREEEKIGLPYNNIKSAAKNFSEIIGLLPINNINNVESSAKKFEFVYAYINYLDYLLFIKFQVVFNDQNKCLAQVIILSQDDTVPKMISDKIYA
jgi:coatomer protein complex subunit gamma